MKCLNCGHDSKYKERRNRSCPGCRKQFALEPREGDPMTDAAFKSCIDAVSADGAVHWGIEHLYYEVCRRRPNWSPGGGCTGTLLAMFSLAGLAYWSWGEPFWGVTALALGAVSLAVLYWMLKTPADHAVPRATFNKMWHRWQEVYGLPEGVIIRRAPTDTPPRPVADDVADYSFDRAVICDRARTVDLLLANQFHFEHNCAVLSVEGYPPHAFDTVRTMLRRNPRLEVFALHDASYKGCKLPERLKADPDWFQGIDIVDVGLHPHQAQRFKSMLVRSKTPSAARDRTLEPRDAKWLSKYQLELAALRPEQVIRALHAAMYGRGDPSDSFG